jgi:hypothetical protein
VSWDDWGREIVLGLLGIALTAILTPLLFGKQRKPAHAGDGSGKLRYPRVVVVLGAFVIFAGITSCVVSDDNVLEEDLFGIASAIFVWIGFPIAGALAVAAYFRVYYALVPGGMRCQMMWRREETSFRWADVTRLQYEAAEHKKYFLVEHSGGRPVKIPLFMSGLSDFARVALAEAPRGVVDASTHGVLGNAAAGYLPDDA